jgi:hypothetical protein
LKIVAAKVETLKLPHGESEEKLTLTFEGEKKKLVINRTNFDVLAEALGDDTDDWLGETVQLYAEKTRFGAKVVPCVRVRIPIKVSNFRPGSGHYRAGIHRRSTQCPTM